MGRPAPLGGHLHSTPKAVPSHLPVLQPPTRRAQPCTACCFVPPLLDDLTSIPLDPSPATCVTARPTPLPHLMPYVDVRCSSLHPVKLTVPKLSHEKGGPRKQRAAVMQGWTQLNSRCRHARSIIRTTSPALETAVAGTRVCHPCPPRESGWAAEAAGPSVRAAKARVSPCSRREGWRGVLCIGGPGTEAGQSMHWHRMAASCAGWLNACNSVPGSRVRCALHSPSTLHRSAHLPSMSASGTGPQLRRESPPTARAPASASHQQCPCRQSTTKHGCGRQLERCLGTIAWNTAVLSQLLPCLACLGYALHLGLGAWCGTRHRHMVLLNRHQPPHQQPLRLLRRPGHETGSAAWGRQSEDGPSVANRCEPMCCHSRAAPTPKWHSHLSTTSSPRWNLKNRTLNLFTSTARTPEPPPSLPLPPPLLPPPAPLLLPLRRPDSSASGNVLIDTTQSLSIQATPSHIHRGPDFISRERAREQDLIRWEQAGGESSCSGCAAACGSVPAAQAAVMPWPCCALPCHRRAGSLPALPVPSCLLTQTYRLGARTC